MRSEPGILPPRGLPWQRAILPLAISVLLLLRPRGPAFDELRFALCFAPWLVLCGLPGVRRHSRSDEVSFRGAARVAAIPLAFALPVLGLALQPSTGLHSVGLIAYAGLLLYLLSLSAERARLGTRTEHVCHAAGWLVLVPLPIALSLAASLSSSPERAATVERALSYTPAAVLFTGAVQSTAEPFASIGLHEREALALHGAFEKILQPPIRAGGAGGALSEILGDLIPALLGGGLLLGLSSLSGRLAPPGVVEGES